MYDDLNGIPQILEEDESKSAYLGVSTDVADKYFKEKTKKLRLENLKNGWGIIIDFVERIGALIIFGILIGFILSAIFFFVLSEYKQYHFFLGLISGLIFPYLIIKIKSMF